MKAAVVYHPLRTLLAALLAFVCGVSVANIEIVKFDGRVVESSNGTLTIGIDGRNRTAIVRFHGDANITTESKLEGQHGEIKWARVPADRSALKRGALVSVTATRQSPDKPFLAVEIVVRLDPRTLPLPGRPLEEQPETPKRYPPLPGLRNDHKKLVPVIAALRI